MLPTSSCNLKNKAIYYIILLKKYLIQAEAYAYLSTVTYLSKKKIAAGQ
jgi:hypothetical protein